MEVRVSVAVVPDFMAGVADGARDCGEAVKDLRAANKKRGGHIMFAEDCENFGRRFGGSIVERQRARQWRASPRQTEGPKNADERPRTAWARKAPEPTMPAATSLAEADILDFLFQLKSIARKNAGLC